jgi:hypothetical protein
MGNPLTRALAILAALVLLSGVTAAEASTTCTTRKFGSVTITSCSSSKTQPYSQCRSYRSGSVIKTTCRN